MAFGSPSDTEPSLVFSPSEYSKSPFERHWQGPNMAGIAPMSPQTRFDTNRWVDTSRPACSPEVACCDDEDCSAECSADCTTVCDGFVDCDKSTACSDACTDAGCDEAECEEAVCDEAHCEEALCTEPDCPDTETACFDTSCFTDSHGNLDQAALDFLNQNDSFQQWCGTTGLIPSCHSNHAPCNFCGPDFGHTAQPNMGKQFRMSPPQDAPSLLKSADFQQYSSQCTYGKHPHIFESPTSPSQGDLIPGNVLHCNMHGAQSCIDSSNQQCNFDFGSANYAANSPLGFVPWSNLHISQLRNHQHFANSKALQLQFSHPHAHIHHHSLHMHSPSTHTPSLSIDSSPVISPIGRGQTASSTYTTPELSATAETHVCKWVHRSNGILRRCGVTFSDSSKLQEHLTLTHSDALGGARGHGYYCCWEGCHRPDEPFSQKSKLQGHFLTHSNHKNFQCSVCGKPFARQATLERHERSHRGDKPYRCKICGKSFTDSSELKTHSRTHTGEKPFKCSFPGCNFETGDSSNMSSHKLTHGERKHKCLHPGCTKSFTRPDQLKRHQRSTHKTGHSPYPLSPPSRRGLSITPC